MEDFARAIVEYILARRERGTAISAADQQLIRHWEELGASIAAVKAGIDDAFDRRREVPRSLKDCARWIRARIKAEAESAGEAWCVGASGAATEPTVPSASLEDELLERAQNRAGAAEHPALRSAYLDLYREMDDILLTEGALDAATMALLDEALVESLLMKLDASDVDALRDKARRQEASSGTEAIMRVLGIRSMLDPD